MDKKYIGAGQAAVIMAALGVFSLITADFTDAGTMLSNAVSAVILIAIALIPLAVLMRNGGGSVPQLAAERIGFIGKIIAVLYSIFFISAAVDFIAEYSVFVSERYYAASPQICAVFLGIICAYISNAGEETVCRMSTVMIFMLILTGAAYVIGGFGDIVSYDYSQIIPRKISLSGGLDGVFPTLAAGAAAMCILCGGMGGRTRAGVFGGAAAMLAALSLVITGVWAVLDDYVFASEYPMTDAVIYSFRNLSFRTDGVFFILWTVIAAAVSSLMCACAGHSLSAAVPRFKLWGIIAAALALIFALARLWGTYSVSVYRSPVCGFILIGLIPLILIFTKERKKAK